MLGAILGIGAGLVGAIGGASARSRANRELEEQIKRKEVFGKERLGLAKTIFGGRMPGATQLQNNILTNQSDTIDTVQKNATDVGQVLGAATQTQVNTNNAFGDLQIKEAQDFARRYGVLDSGYNDYNKIIDDQISMKGAQAQNRGQTWQELSNLGFGVAQFDLAGGFNGGGGGNGGYSSLPYKDRMALNNLGRMGLKW